MLKEKHVSFERTGFYVIYYFREKAHIHLDVKSMLHICNLVNGSWPKSLVSIYCPAGADQCVLYVSGK